jgi:hypothetical protein
MQLLVFTEQLGQLKKTTDPAAVPTPYFISESM